MTSDQLKELFVASIVIAVLALMALLFGILGLRGADDTPLERDSESFKPDHKETPVNTSTRGSV